MYVSFLTDMYKIYVLISAIFVSDSFVKKKK